MNEAFESSSEDLVLYFKGDKKEAVYAPGVLTTFDAFDRHMRESLPDIYKSSDSFIGIMKLLNVIFRDGDMLWKELPYREAMMNGLIGLAKGNTNTPILRLYFDRDMKMSQITIYFSDHTSDNLLRIRDAAYKFFEKYPMNTEDGEFFLAGGRIGMEMATNEEMKRTHAVIDIMVLTTIFVLCTVFYRSVVAGLMLTLPLILGNMVAFAYMALANIGLSINTLPVAAVGVGVGVDFAIYIYNRCIEEFPRRNGWEETILASVRTSGKAVVYTGLTMVLPIMVWFFISDLKFQAQMGVFLAMILSTNVLLAITLHPLLINLIRPRFVTKLGLTNKGAEEKRI
jgi:predicted RND superfamily exporter protein